MTVSVAPEAKRFDFLSLAGVPIFIRTAPEEARIAYEKPVCTQSERCKDCPYPAHGFVCWHDESKCLRTEMEKISERRKRKNGSNHQ